jgi:hypothetical protein
MTRPVTETSPGEFFFVMRAALGVRDGELGFEAQGRGRTGQDDLF